jgi:hypothetical protein
LELVRPKAEPNDYSSLDDNHHHHGNGGLGLDPTRSFPAAALLGLQSKNFFFVWVFLLSACCDNFALSCNGQKAVVIN